MSYDMRCGKRLPLWKRRMAKPRFIRVRQAAIIVFLGTGTPCATYTAYCGILAVSGNFHTVKAGQLSTMMSGFQRTSRQQLTKWRKF